MSAPRTLHLTAVHRIIRNVRATADRGLFLPSSSSLELSAYSSAAEKLRKIFIFSGALLSNSSSSYEGALEERSTSLPSFENIVAFIAGKKKDFIALLLRDSV